MLFKLYSVLCETLSNMYEAYILRKRDGSISPNVYSMILRLICMLLYLLKEKKTILIHLTFLFQIFDHSVII